MCLRTLSHLTRRRVPRPWCLSWVHPRAGTSVQLVYPHDTAVAAAVVLVAVAVVVEEGWVGRHTAVAATLERVRGPSSAQGRVVRRDRHRPRLTPLPPHTQQPLPLTVVHHRHWRVQRSFLMLRVPLGWVPWLHRGPPCLPGWLPGYTDYASSPWTVCATQGAG